MKLTSLAVFLFSISLCLAASAGTFERFPLPRIEAMQAYDIAAAETYAWVIPYGVPIISKVGTDGSVRTFALPVFGAHQIALDPLDGSVWYASPSHIGHVTLDGLATEWWLPSPFGYSVRDLKFGPDGNLWMIREQQILRVTRSAEATVFFLQTGFYPSELTVGADGNLWISAHNSNKLGRMTTSGTLTIFDNTDAHDSPNAIVSGPDGNLWFTSSFGYLKKITTAGAITTVSGQTASSHIVTANSRLWWARRPSPGIVKYNVTSNAIESTYELGAENDFLHALSASPDAVWWGSEGKKFGRITFAGHSQEWPYLALGPNPSAMARSTLHVWFVSPEDNKVGRTDPTTGETVLYDLPHPDSRPLDIVAGPDAMWFTEETGDRIGRIDGNGNIQEHTVQSIGGKPTSIAFGADGNFWFTLAAADKIGRMTPAGVVTEFPLPGLGRYPNSIAAGPDGNLWFTMRDADKIGRITLAGVVTEFDAGDDEPRAIVSAPDGNLWYATRSRYHKITPSGQMTMFPPWVHVSDSVIGADGALWGNQSNGITRTTMDGASHTWRIMPDNVFAGDAITIGPDNRIWVSQSSAGTLYRVIPDAPIAAAPNPVCRTTNGYIDGLLATFTDPDTTREVSDYSAKISWRGATPESAAIAKIGPGQFTVSGWYSSAASAPNPVIAFTSTPGTNLIGQTASTTAVIHPFSAAASRADFTKEGGTSTIQVSTPNACPWSASSNVGWITFPSGTSGSGAAGLAFQVGANATGFSRQGIVTINGELLVIRQSALRDPRSSLYLVTPCRFLDTRDAQWIPPSRKWELAVAGQCGIAADATAIVANVTVIDPAADGWLSLYAGGTVWPGTSTVNYRAGRTRANNAIIPLTLDVFAVQNGGEAPVHFLIDVTGYFK